jgi:hypothetical protein
MAFTVTAKAIVPKGFDAGKMKREIQSVLDKEGKRDRPEFAKTTQGWSSAPAMGYETGITSSEAYVWIGPKSGDIEKWVRIDEGTPSRNIASANKMVFPFQGRGKSYIPKTRPLWMGSSGSGGQKLGPIVRTNLVKGHSIEARLWSKTLAAQRIGPFASNIQAAVARGLK